MATGFKFINRENCTRRYSFRRVIELFLTVVTGICGIFLFSVMSQQNQNVDHSNYSIIAYVGGTAILAVFVSETYSSIETQKLKHEESKHDDEDEDEDDEEKDDNENEEDDTEINAPVSECSWFIVGLSFLGTSSYSAIYFTYALNSTESKYWQIAFIISPMAFVSFMMAFFMKQKRNDCKYKVREVEERK